MIKQTYIVYLDEFGHVGTFISRDDAKHKTSPIFGLDGFILPADQVRHFSNWFYQLKCNLLSFELAASGAPPYRWEKKGASLYTTQNVTKYPELRKATFRLFNKIDSCGGHIFYTGVEKYAEPEEHRPNEMMLSVLREAIKRLDQFCLDVDGVFLIFLDHHDDDVLRDALTTVCQKEMFGVNSRQTLVEVPTQIESHRHQAMQATDWLCGLIGRTEAFRTRPLEYPDFEWTYKYFVDRMRRVAVRSGVRKQSNVLSTEVDGSQQ